MYMQRIIDDIDDTLPKSPYVRPGGSLLMMVGLPGTGKSSIVNSLHALIPFVVIRTDGIRLLIRRQPTYTAAERSLVYEVCYALIERRLRAGERVVFDASNYLAARREYLISLATKCGAPVTICYVQASQSAIQSRLVRRISGNRHQGDLSDAGWSVYNWMVEVQEPVVEPHLILDTTSTPPTELAQRLHEYWLSVEANADSNPDLQSPSWASKLRSDE